MKITGFEVGKTYNRLAEIHGQYEGQRQGGISTPKNHPYIFIFTGDAGKAYGYIDGYGADDTFWYTGEGQKGDMNISNGGNRAIREHSQNNKKVMLFEATDSAGEVRFVGNCEYITHHEEERPDKHGDLRKAIIFHMDIKQSISDVIGESKKRHESPKKPRKSMSLKELRELALRPASDTSSKEQKIANIQNRAKAIKLYAKKRANGYCEGCGENAPFNSKEGPYLEVHHMNRLADGGPDHPENVIALCPTCHRRAHYATDFMHFNSSLIEKMRVKESEID